MTKTQPTTAPTPAESGRERAYSPFDDSIEYHQSCAGIKPAPQSAPAQGETPRTDAETLWPASNDDSDRPDPKGAYVMASFARQLERELNEAKTLYAAALDTLKDMSAQVAQLTSERDQARQDLEERCAENDRERAAHLQAYQEAVKERDAARATIESDHMAAQEHKDKLRVQRDAAESELAELRLDRELLDCVDSSTEIQVIGGRNEFDQPFWIAQHRHKTQTIDCAGKSARDAIRCLMNRLADFADIDAARQSSSKATHQQGEGL